MIFINMPLPKPIDSESKTDFIQRCMGDDKTASEFPSQQQRYLVCARQWEADRSAFAETYADYGDGVKNNAKRGIELNERSATSAQRRQARSERSSLRKAKASALKLSSGCIATYRAQRRTTTTQTAPATADTSATCFGAARRRLAGAGTSYEN